MIKIKVSKKFPWDGAVTERVGALMRIFGVSVDRMVDEVAEHCCEFEVGQGEVVYITGPSGAGKSVLLREIEGQVPGDERVNLSDIELSGKKAMIDCVGGDIVEAMRILGAAGLSDVFCLLNRPGRLSEGQQYRYRLAAAMSGGRRFIFADEFCSNLDRITAAVIAYNVRRYARREGVTFFLASSHEDILADLQPDVLVVKGFDGEAEIVRREILNSNI